MLVLLLLQVRVLAAKNMVERLKSSKRRDLLLDMERLCLAYIQLANFNVLQYKNETSESVEGD